MKADPDLDLLHSIFSKEPFDKPISNKQIRASIKKIQKDYGDTLLIAHLTSMICMAKDQRINYEKLLDQIIYDQEVNLRNLKLQCPTRNRKVEVYPKIKVNV